MSLSSLACVLCVVGFIRSRCVHWGAHWGLSGLSGVAGFIWVLSVCHRANPGSLASLVRALWEVTLSGFAGFFGVRPGGRPVHP